MQNIRSKAPYKRVFNARTVLGSMLLIIVPFGLQASTPPQDLSEICERAAWVAAEEHSVPISVMKAISLTETGRKKNGAFRPWPWTVNMEGKGIWFDNEDDARSYVYKHYKRGARSFDVGCFQINYRWHGQEFASIDEMFDPAANARYAARFLKTLYQEKGTWSAAAGAYHSRTPKFANKYTARFENFRKKFRHEDGGTAPDLPDNRDIPEIPDIVLVANGGAPASRRTEPDVNRVNSYPLLQTGGTGGLGSLVPLGNGGSASLFAPSPPASGS